jgi:very-short-patch-repair endonuclease
MQVDPIFRERARELRREMTPAEKILWRALRSRRFADLKFRRQHPMGSFILDFYCARARLVVEVDGETHLGRALPDQQRTAWLQSQGLTVVRYWNNQLYDDFDTVLESLWSMCHAAVEMPSPHPQPLSPGYRGEGRIPDSPTEPRMRGTS